jgi:two-component system sensor histidine kinase PhoQ
MNQFLQRQLQTQLYMILTAAEEQSEGQIYLPEVVQDDLFNQIDSGVYALVATEQDEVWRSFSAVDLDLPLSIFSQPGQYRYDEVTLDGIDYHRLDYSIIWESDSGKETGFTIAIYQDQSILQAVIKQFDFTLLSGMAVVLAIIIVIQYLALRWGLLPLNFIAKDLLAIESGKQQQLSSDYPTEIMPLSNNINQLLSTEKNQRERYKQTLSNLAHSLKTPLAVLSGLFFDEKSDQSKTIQDQIKRMDDIVQHHLTRASTSGKGTLLNSVNVAIELTKVIQALNKVYFEKQLSVTIECNDDVRFFGDESDFLEVIGNLIDNAYKWASSQVLVCASMASKGHQHTLKLSVNDDGPGVDPTLQEHILTRGARLDETPEGQGIGLSMVSDIVRQYDGEINITDSQLGGASFAIVFSFGRA